MFREYFVFLLLGHILGDFYIQTSKMAKKKQKSLKWVLIHCLYYGGVMLFIGLPIMSWEFVAGAMVAAGLHFFLDVIKFAYLSWQIKKDKWTQIIERNVFFMDQLLHVLCLILIGYWLARNIPVVNEWKVLEDFFHVIGISKGSIISWSFALLVVHKPANIAIQKLLTIYKPEHKDEDKQSDKNAGRFIGTVERIIMLIFLGIGQYSAIGLVLTAKSIARYDRISKEKDFAEYYLLGTLISTVIVIVCSFAI